MTHIAVHRWLARAGFVASMGLVLIGCPEDAIDITDTPSDAAQNFPISSVFFAPEGTFALDRLTLVAFDTSVADAFDRSVPGPRGLEWSGGFWDFDGLWRNGAADTRLPALVDDDAIAGRFVITDGSIFGLPASFNPFFTDFGWANLDPNTTYTLAFVRYNLRINAELDAAAIALGEPVTQPDELVLEPIGTPKGDPTSNIEPFADIFAQADANPFVLGHIVTDANGEVDMDVLIDAFTSSGEAVFYQDLSGDPPAAAFDSAIVARNDDTPTTLPRYNYLVLFRGSATTAAEVLNLEPAMRLQMAQDFLEDGTPVNNGYAPFPADQFSAPVLVAAPGGAGRPDSLTVTFNDLEALTDGAAYEAWLVNPNTGSAIPAVGTYNRVELTMQIDPVTGEPTGFTEEIVETVPNTASFVGGNGDDGFRHQLIVSDNTLPAGDTLGLHSYLVLTLAESPGGSSLPESQSFWFQFTDQNETPANFFDDQSITSGTTTFGRFDSADPSASIPYGADGGGLGGFRGDILGVSLSSISRPPVGYVYVGWLLRADGSAARLPDITGPPPERVSLVNADVTMEPGLVTSKGILEANLRVDAAEQGIDFGEFTRFVLTLEPKSGESGMGFIPTHAGDVPDVIASAPSGGG